MEQYDEALGSTNTALNSSGSGYRENAEYLKSYEAQINMVKNAWTETVLAMKDSGLGDGIVVSLKVGLEFFKLLTLIIDKIGLLPALLGAGSVGFLLFSGRARTAGLSLNELLLKIGTLPGAAMRGQISLTGMMAALQRMTANTVAATVASNALRVAMSFALPVVAIMAVGAAISAVTGKISENAQKQRELREEVEKRAQADVEAVTMNREKVNDLIDSYEYLSNAKKHDEGWDTEKEMEFLEIQQELGELFPSLVKSIDAKGRAHLIEAESIEGVRRETEELVVAERNLQLIRAKDEYQERIKGIKEATKELEKQKKELQTLEKWMKEAEQGRSVIESDGFGGSRTVSPEEVKERFWAVEREILLGEGIVAGAYGSLNNKMEEMFTVELEGTVNKVTPKIAENMRKLITEFDLSGLDKKMNPQEIEMIVERISSYADKLNEAFTKRDSAGYDELLTELMSYVEGHEIETDIIDGVILKYDDMMDAIASNMRAQEEGKNVTDEYSDSVDGVGDSLSEAKGEMDDVISKIKEVNSILEEYNDNGYLTNETMLKVIDTYPELIAHINDEARLIEELTNIRDEDARNAEETLISKMMASEDFYTGNLTLIEDFVKEQFKFYQGDLKDWQNLAQAKADIEVELINKISKQWGVYYDKLSKQFVNPDLFSTEKFVEQNHSFALPFGADGTKELNALLQANEELKSYANTWNDFSIGQVSLDFKALGSSIDKIGGSTNKASKSAKEANKTTKSSTYITNEYTNALEKLNAAIRETQNLKSQFPKHSAQYRKAVEQEIKLEKQKIQLQERQAKALEQQIKSGSIAQTGIITSSAPAQSTTVNKKLSGWNGRQTSSFGYRKDPFTGASRYHSGMDIAMARGTRLDANIGGTVTHSGSKGNGFGNYVEIKDAKGQTHIYAHLEKAMAKVGQTVVAGMQIGTIGSTGRSTGPHLHYEMRNAQGKAIDPSAYARNAQSGKVTTTSSAPSSSDVARDAANAQQAVDSAKSDLLGLYGSIADAKNSIGSLELELVNSRVAEFEQLRARQDRNIEMELLKSQFINDSSKEYVKSLDNQIKHTKEKNRVSQRELDYLSQQVTSSKLSSAATFELKERIFDLKEEMVGLQLTLRQLDLEKIESVMKGYSKRISDVEYLVNISKEYADTLVEGSSTHVKESANQVKLLKQQQNLVLSQRKELEKILKTSSLTHTQKEEMRETVQGLTLDYWKLENSIRDSNKGTADYVIEQMKKVYEYQRDAAMKVIDDERTEYQKLVNDKIKILNDSYREDDYRKELEEKRQAEQELSDRINNLLLDDSQFAKAERSRLEKELEELQSGTADFIRDYEREQRQKSLEEELEAKEEEFAEKEEKTERHWENLIEDEREWAKVREDIMNGNTKKYIDSLQVMSRWTNEYLEDIGESIGKNMIDELNKAIALMKQVTPVKSKPKNIPSASTDNLGNTKAPSTATPNKPKPAPKPKPQPKPKKVAVGNKARVSGNNVSAYLDSYGKNVKPWATQARAAGVAYGATMNVVNRRGDYYALSKNKSVGSAIAWVKEKDLVGLKTGGMTPDNVPESGALALLHKKELVLSENQTSDTLKTVEASGDLLAQLNALLPTIPSLASPSISNSQESQANTFNFKIENLNGTREDARNFFDEINDELQGMGVRFRR